MRSWVTFGSSTEDLEILLTHVAQGSEVEWSLHDNAEPGDRVLLYWTAPLSAFVAHGLVARRSEARWHDPSGDDKAMAYLSEIRMLPTPVSLTRARAELPSLKWLKTPAGFGTQPRSQLECDQVVALGDASTRDS